ncbi:MAG: hypothetical protein WBQ66_03310 [Blastocatellia bacterium]
MQTSHQPSTRARSAKLAVLFAVAALGAFTAYGQTAPATGSAPSPQPAVSNSAAPAVTNSAPDGKAVPQPAAATPAQDASGAAPAVAEGDPAAKLFLQKCAGCHTIGKGKLTGPDLNEASTWQAPDLDKGIKAMEVKVGPLANEDIVLLRDFLKSADVRDRLAAEQERAAKATAASFDPPSPIIGEALFTGRTQLSGGGMACIACHSVSGNGGNLALPLDGVHAKLGETPLQSAIEKTSFKVMTAAYRNHPVTKQEAIHLTAYLGSLQPTAPVATTRVPIAGAIGAAVLFVALGLAYGGRRTSVRQQLLRRRRDGLD